MKNPLSNTDVLKCRPQHLFGVDHRLAYPILFALVEANKDPARTFVVTEGMRTSDRQVYLRKIGATKTLNSKHLIGLAVDVAILGPDGVVADLEPYKGLSELVEAWDLKYNGARLIKWGGDWLDFKDGCHFEL